MKAGKKFKSNYTYAKEIVHHLKQGVVAKGKRVGITVETQEKGDEIIKLIDILLPKASKDWELKIIVIGEK